MRESQKEVFWNLVKNSSERSEFDALFEQGGPTAVINAQPPFNQDTATEFMPDFSFHKSIEGFHAFTEYPIVEPPLKMFDSFYTANDLFFVCNEITTPQIAIKPYTLRIEGDAISQPLELSYNDIVALPSKTLDSYLECAGNHRAMFERSLGKRAVDVQWDIGGVGMAAWTGVALKTILDLAGLKDNAKFVNIKGLDKSAPEGGVSRPMTIEKALHEDTLLAYGMNGELLPPDHGFPIRAIAPGWIGANSVKWAGVITVSAQEIWVDRNTNTYTYQGDTWNEADYAPAKGAAITTQNVRSSVILPWNAQLNAGKQTLKGFARSPFAEIAKVEWSDNSGESWQEASLKDPIKKWAWVFFEFEWNAPQGKQSLMTRATDKDGNTQPMNMPYNEKGYMFNMVYAHPVTIS